MISMTITGLSPLARGTHLLRGSSLHLCRFIPAGAGNTSSSNSLIRLAAVYPRWRGEHAHANANSFLASGLSPLARGTPRFTHPDTVAWRFIPAGAGNTTPRATLTQWRPVYPRWRGEHCLSTKAPSNPSGLSPLARGTPIPGTWAISFFRFIPAGAGNTWRPPTETSWRSVYPRWRGEHTILNRRSPWSGGLSPLARGTPQGGSTG